MATARPPRRGSFWRPSRAVPWAGGLLAVLIVAGVVWLGWFEYREIVERERARVELLARVLEDHATRTVETTAIALSSLAELLAGQASSDASEIGPLLNQALVGLPFLRSLCVLDRQGSVLVTTAARDFGRRIDPGRLGPWPAIGRDRLGGLLPGRSLADLDSGAGAAPVPAGVGFIPFVHALKMRSGEQLLLVALINPDALANHQAMTVGDGATGALLASPAGELLAGTAAIAPAPGRRLADHPVFGRYLAEHEHTSYLGAGARAEPQLVAFRASRSRPLVVLVEHPQAALRADWWQAMGSFFGLAAALLLFVAATTATAWRSLRARETARRQLDAAQAEVARRERELSVTIRSVQELIFRTDADGAITFVNARWAVVGGTSAQAAIGRRLHELVLPGQRDAVRALFAADAGPGVRSAHATVGDAPSGRPRHFDLAVVPLLHQGRITGFAGSAVDVTDRVVAEQQLQTQLAVSALMLEVSPLPLSMADAAGRCLSVNQAWEEFTGRRRQDVVGRRLAEFFGAEDAALHEAHDRELLRSGGRLRYAATVAHQDGSRREVLLIKVVVPGDDGTAAGILCVTMDVSEFRAAERATQEARDAAEEASRAKTEFIANISHELRTPLQSILGFSELGAARGRAHERLAAMFTDIHTAGRRMLALVNDLLDVAKIESTVGTFHLERTDLRPLVREVAREIDPLLAPRRLVLELALSELPLLAKVDPMRFQQVVRNVLANAIKFSPEGGRIELLGETTAAGEVHLRVSDQGPGIPPAELERVFEAFVQSSQTKDGSGGTGLGLAICRKILEAHGGRIQAQNLQPHGTAFHVLLPARGATETAPMPL